MSIEILVIKGCLKVCSLVVSSPEPTSLSKRHKTRVHTGVRQLESRMVQLEVIINLRLDYSSTGHVFNFVPE